MERFTKISNYFQNLRFSSLSLVSKIFLAQMSSKTKCGLISLIFLKPCLAYTKNPISHFWHFNSLFHFHYHLIHLAFKLILIRPLGPHLQISKFSIFHLGLFLGSINFTFHNLTIYQFSRKNPSLAQFIPEIYIIKIIIKILGYF